MRYGHPPDAIDDYAWRDVELFLEAWPAILDQERQPLFGGDQ